MEYVFRQSVMGDLPGVWRVICDAKRIMAEQGRNQWTDDYPSLAGIEADIRSGDAYVLVSGGGEVAVYAYVTMKPEPVYAAIAGRWLTAGPYAVVHRLAVGAAFRGRGLARRLMLHAEDIARQGGAGSIRVDTNHDNAEMLRLLSALGYSRCGTVSYGPRGVRMAFEKIV